MRAVGQVKGRLSLSHGGRGTDVGMTQEDGRGEGVVLMGRFIWCLVHCRWRICQHRLSRAGDSLIQGVKEITFTTRFGWDPPYQEEGVCIQRTLYTNISSSMH